MVPRLQPSTDQKDGIWQGLVPHFQPEEIIELAAVCGISCYLNRMAELLQVDIPK